MAEVIWSDRALGELEQIRLYIRQFSPLAAQRVAVKLIGAGQSLELFPERGRITRRGLRDLISVHPYLIRYKLQGDVVEIVTIRHGARAPDA